MTDASLQARARTTECYAGALRELANSLPPGDDTLEAALTQALAERDEDAFPHLLLAAFAAGRPVDGRLLETGAALLPLPGMLLTAAVHCTGDVGGALLAAVRGGRLGPAGEALALALAAWWSRERAGCEVPAEAIRHGRVLARSRRSLLAMNMLLVLSDLAGDPDLTGLLPSASKAAQQARDDFDHSIARTKEDPLACVPEERPPTVLSGYTVRRAVSRVGRNDPCPCGSGKKYKRCCFEPDRERLRHSSDVEGLTVDELRKNPEPYLTRQRLFGMNPYELARIDAARVETALHGPLIRRLREWRDFDAAARVFEAVGWSPELDDDLVDVVEEAAALGQADLVRRLVALRGEHDDNAELTLRARIVAEGLDPGPTLELIESTARKGLDDELELVELAYALLAGRYPALGVLVARGVLWTANDFDGWALLQELLETRDRLGLSPVDPVEDPVEAYWRDGLMTPENREAAPTVDTETRLELEAKLAEARTLRAELRQRDAALEEMERKLSQIEDRDARAEAEEKTAPAAGQDAHDTALVGALRRKLAERKEEVKQKHAERNVLRAELARARQEVEALRGLRPDEAGLRVARTEPEEPDDDALLFPAAAAEKQPPRLPRFERQFGDDLHNVPVAVARAALQLIGRLAAGESAAFRGARHLRSHREVWRQRVGLSYRLLFRTESDALIVLSLVTRQDLDRAVRAL